jgi:prepilin peptidase CpaA
MGAGDVKLMAAAGAFLGPVDAFTAAALAIVMGGGLAVAVVVLRLVESTPLAEFSLRDASTPVLRLFATISAARKERFPYATAIAAGVVTTLALRGSLEQFYSFWAFE